MRQLGGPQSNMMESFKRRRLGHKHAQKRNHMKTWEITTVHKPRREDCEEINPANTSKIVKK